MHRYPAIQIPDSAGSACFSATVPGKGMPAADTYREICSKNGWERNPNENKVLLHLPRDFLLRWLIRKAVLLKWNHFHSRMQVPDIVSGRCRKNQQSLLRPSDRRNCVRDHG